MEMGLDKYLAIGTNATPGTKLLSVSGDCNKPGVYEISMTESVEEFIYGDNYLGGIKNGKKLKGATGEQHNEVTEMRLVQ